MENRSVAIGVEQTVKVFIYGTLLKGEVNHKVIAPFIVSLEKGKISGRLVDAGSFPAAILDDMTKEVHGEWATIKTEGLVYLDRLEGYIGPNENNFYDRVIVRDKEKNISGFVYTWHFDRGMPVIESGSWWTRLSEKYE